MTRSVFETILGAAIICFAGFFLMYGAKMANVSTGQDGYVVYAYFSGTGGLKVGDEVQISGVRVGAVQAIELDQDTYLARVHILVGSGYELPLDTAALISSEGLLGGKYLALEPGAEEDIIEAGGRIEFTQAPQNLEQLLGQFIFSMQDDDDSAE